MFALFNRIAILSQFNSSFCFGFIFIFFFRLLFFLCVQFWSFSHVKLYFYRNLFLFHPFPFVLLAASQAIWPTYDTVSSSSGVKCMLYAQFLWRIDTVTESTRTHTHTLTGRSQIETTKATSLCIKNARTKSFKTQ